MRVYRQTIFEKVVRPDASEDLTRSSWLPCTRAIDSPSPICLSVSKGEKMTYDWDGQRTRRAMAFKLMTAVAVGLSVPLAVTIWSYIG